MGQRDDICEHRGTHLPVIRGPARNRHMVFMRFKNNEVDFTNFQLHSFNKTIHVYVPFHNFQV